MSRMRYGTCVLLEEEADRLIKESLEGVYSHKAKKDILTPWKAGDRKRREVYVKGSPRPEDDRSMGLTPGTPEKTMRQGMFHRVANTGRPDLNSRDGLAPPHRTKSGDAYAWDAGSTVVLTGVPADEMTLECYKEIFSG